ncbi:MAG: restriction endonuclease subunit S [Cyclobacteriaceae bacterium]|nr:MAG: restriction endonuclease subunit S [Cyclobacteriaceae bacterium]
MSYRSIDFTSLVTDVTGGKKKYQTSEYQKVGLIPVVDQGKETIAGFVNEDDYTINVKKPYVIFGDHTKTIKYIDFPFVLGADGVKVLETVDELHPKYLYYFLQTIKLPDAGYNRHFKYLKETKIPLPPLPIQKKIAAILDKADSLRQKDKQLLEHYDKLAQSIFHDMFGDPVMNAKGWDRLQLSSVCVQITDGTHFSPPPSDSGVPYITAKHLKLSGLDFYSDPTYVSLEEHQKIFARCRPEKGDVLYIKDGATTGIAAINHYDFEFSMLSSLALIKPDGKNLNNYYLKSWLNHEKVKENLIRNYMAGAAIKRFTLSKINLFEIPLPPMSLQSEFKRKIEKIESSTSIVLKSYKQSDFLFQGLLQKAFKGELVKES